MNGCFYNPRPSPGRCIKDTRSNVVESQCELVNDTCILKKEPISDNNGESTKKIIYVPTPVTLERLKKEKTEKISERSETNNTENNLDSELSGPITAYSGSYNDEDGIKKLIFLGDAHFSDKNKCSPPCKSIGSDLNLIDTLPKNSCWTTNRLLMDIFLKAQEKKEYVDFYLEIPFLPKLGYKPSKTDINKVVKLAGEIYDIFYTFYDYFTKIKTMDYVRFHYVDVRLQYKPAGYKQLADELLLDIGQVPFEQKETTYEDNIINRINNSIILLGEYMYQDKRSRNNYVETTDKLIKNLYFSGGQTMQGYEQPLNVKLFNLYLSSDNFITDSKKLISSEHIPEGLLEYNTVNRRGKVMHRVRAQLEDLENRGYRKVVEDIKNFVMTEYIKNVNNNLLMELWRKFMKIYDNYINSRTRTLGDNITAIEILKQEYSKIMSISYLNVSSTALLMDAYLLARMFRFNIPDKNQTKIVYAGAMHTDNYYRFFRDYLKVNFHKYGTFSLDADINNINRCIKVDINKFL